jgi:hypothetical protein
MIASKVIRLTCSSGSVLIKKITMFLVLDYVDSRSSWLFLAILLLSGPSGAIRRRYLNSGKRTFD